MPFASTGDLAFDLVGDLTVHGVTKPSVWHVTAIAKNGVVSGTATTSFTFEDFGMTRPSTMMVLSVDDTIHLEYDFTLQPAS
jgi:polyisoprenoid-binding protein YceI